MTRLTLNAPESLGFARGHEEPAPLTPLLRCSIVQQCNVKLFTAHLNGEFK